VADAPHAVPDHGLAARCELALPAVLRHIVEVACKLDWTICANGAERCKGKLVITPATLDESATTGKGTHLRWTISLT
jgi:hypothetical protein